MPPERKIRLLIADDQPLIRRGLAIMLATEPDIEVVGKAGDGQEAIDLANELRPDIVVMDLQMPRVSGVVATREITARHPETRVVVLTTYDDDELVFDAIRAGAHAYLLKDAYEAEVMDTIRAVHRGESRLSPVIARKVLEQFRDLIGLRAGASAPPKPSNESKSAAPQGSSQPVGKVSDASSLAVEPLTSKEQRVLDLLAQGKSNKEIANEMFLAEGTVKNYVSRIMEKLHARNRIELAVLARSGQF